MTNTYISNAFKQNAYRKLANFLKKNVNDEAAVSIMLLVSAILYVGGAYKLTNDMKKENEHLDKSYVDWYKDSNELLDNIQRMNETNKRYFENKSYNMKNESTPKTMDFAELLRIKHASKIIHKKSQSLMKRMPSEQEWRELQTRLNNGEKYTDILTDLGLD